MKTKYTNGMKANVEQATANAAPRQQRPFESLDDIEKRIQGILQGMMRERWLPIALRSLIVEEVASMRMILKESASAMPRLAQTSHSLALSTFTFGDCMYDSDTVRQIRVLDLELNPNALVFAGLIEGDFASELAS
ncbi:MAG: hypothetical protein AAGB46_01160 [Verrucomicrobiota bacterium]